VFVVPFAPSTPRLGLLAYAIVDTSRQHGRIVNLQALRFVAALGVVLYHLAPFYPRLAGDAAPFAGVAAWGFLGVDVFFVLSGFIIAESTRGLRCGRGIARFALRRLARLYLAWWPVGLAAAMAAWLGGGSDRQIDFTGSFLLLPISLEQRLVPITWTLSFELAFYAFVAVALIVGRQWCLPLLLAQASAVVAANAVFITSGLYTPAGLADAGIIQMFLLSPFWLQFIAGFALAETLHHRPPPRHARALLIPASVLALLTVLAAAGVLPSPRSLFSFFETPQRIALGLAVAVALVHALVVLERCYGRTLPNWSARLGDTSYSLYLTHTLVLHWGAHALEGIGLVAHSHLGPGLLLVAALAVGVGVSYSAEWPLYRAASRWTRRLLPPPAAAIARRPA